MPGPLRERDPNVDASRRSSVQVFESLRPKSRLSHQRLPEHEPLPANQPEENLEPHFMASTAASSSRSIIPSTPPSASTRPRRAPTPHALLALGSLDSKQTSPKPADDTAGSSRDSDGTSLLPTQSATQPPSPKPHDGKPLPSHPVAQVVTTSPYKEGRTLIDASEKPLRRSPGTPHEEDWPTLFPTQPATPGLLQDFSASHSAPSFPKQEPKPIQISMEPTINASPASPSKQRPTIKMVPQTSSENILRTGQTMVTASTSQPQASLSQNGKIGGRSSPSKSTCMKDSAASSTLPTTLPQPKPRLVDIPSPKSRLGRRPPITNYGGIPRARGIPRPSGPVHGNAPRQIFQQPHSDHPRGYPRMDTPTATSPELQSVNDGSATPLSPAYVEVGNMQRKKSAIPVPARATSPQTIPPGPAVFTLKAKVSTPSTLGGKSLSTIESVDTGATDQGLDTSTVMRDGPQRRPTLSKSARDYKHLSADTDTNPTTVSAQTEVSAARPSTRTESSLWVETDNTEGTHADELIMGRKTTPSPPVPPLGVLPARNSGQKARDLHRMAVTNEHSAIETRRQSSGDSIQAETFTVRSSGEHRPSSLASSSPVDTESLRLLNASQIEANSPNDAARTAAVSQTLAMLEGGYGNGNDDFQFDRNAPLTTSSGEKNKSALSIAKSSGIFRRSQMPRDSSGNFVRSDSGRSINSNKRQASISRDPGNLKRSSSVISIASSRPPVPAKDHRPAAKAPLKDPSIQKRKSLGRVESINRRSPYGLSNGYSAIPSNIPQPINGCRSSGRLSSGRTTTEAARSASGEKRSMSRAKLTMSGFRGLFHKRTDVKNGNKAGEKKKRTNLKVSSTGSPVPGLNKVSACRSIKAPTGRGSPGRPGTLTKSCHNHPAECFAASPPPELQVSEVTQTTALAMHITTMAREEEDESKRHQLLSIATAMLGAIDSAKHAKIAAEQAAQAAREASMHQEMTRQSLIAINKVLANSPGILGALSRSRTNLRRKTSRPSTMEQ